MAEDKVQWWNIINTVINLQVPYNTENSELTKGLPPPQLHTVPYFFYRFSGFYGR
jgi:hypothetical protein